MDYKNVHIGHEIESIVLSRNINNAEFGRMIGVPKQNVKRIFERANIDTLRLVAISKALDYNFFMCFFNEETKTKNITHGDASPAGDYTTNISYGSADTIAALQNQIALLEQRIADKDEIISLLKERPIRQTL